MKRNKDNRGITLIALVVTIIVLLILAGASINMLTGQNGILTNAAKDEAVEEFLENWEKEAEVAADGYLQLLQSTREELEAVIRKGEAGLSKKEILISLKRIHQNINNNL